MLRIADTGHEGVAEEADAQVRDGHPRIVP
jgi:hypothetical protein